MADIQVEDLFSVKGLVALVTGGGTGESFSLFFFVSLGWVLNSGYSFLAVCFC